jgi:Ribosomal protein L11 methyltransferase (PrmA)
MPAQPTCPHPHVVSGRAVLDVGSGSGIVAIASMKAGTREVVACCLLHRRDKSLGSRFPCMTNCQLARKTP